MPYRKKIPARAKRNFKRVAKKMVNYKKKTFRPRKLLNGQGDTRDFLKITMSRQITKANMLVASDQSMSFTILNNPMTNITPNTDHASNLLYHPDFSKFNTLYRQYKVSCIVYKISRPNVNFCYNNTTPNQTHSVQLPTLPWGTKILHSTLSYAPDAVTNTTQSNTNLVPRVNTIAPNNWREAVDDGRKLFHNHDYKRTCTRVWKPVGAFEKRWRYFNVGGENIDDQELARGGLHIRVQKDHPLNLVDKTGTGNNWNYMPQTVLFDVEATVYMHYKDRM